MTKAVREDPWSFRELKRLFVQTYNEWNADQAPRLGAALAYYTTLSLAPLLILLIAVAGFVFGTEAAQGQLFGQIRDMVGSEGAKAIEEMIQNASKPTSGIVASLIGFVMLIFGASSVAAELRASLNAIWNQPFDPTAGIKEMVRERSYALVVVIGCGFLLVVSLVISSVIAAGGKYVSGYLPLPEVMLQLLNVLLSVAVLALVFAMMFKYLPDITIEWRDVLLGALVTSVLFTIGKFLIGMYLGKASFGSTYGAAGSLIVVLVWVYYSSQIFFFGAEFTQVYAREYGSDPFKRKGKEQSKTPKRVLATPAPAVAQLAKQAASGGTAPAAKPGMAGAMIGGALAITKALRALRPR